MKVVLGRPQSQIDLDKTYRVSYTPPKNGQAQKWEVKGINNPPSTWHKDLESLYDRIPLILKDMGVECQVVNINPYDIKNISNGLFIGFHTKGNQKNVWHIKDGYIPGYPYLDKLGYSGWSEGATRYNAESKPWDIENTLNIITSYIKNDVNKMPQPVDTSIPPKPYILVLGQKPGDSVAQLADISTKELGGLVTKAYKDTKFNVYIKPHPIDKTVVASNNLIYGSLHKLIKEASAIYTVNSGSGFQALFQFKKVYTSGKCDYSPVTHRVTCFEDIKNTITEPMFKQSEILHFLDYCLHEHFVNAYDDESIRRKLVRIIKEYDS